MIPQIATPVSFQCSICEEPSERICVYCTKDTCENHICEKCLRCSDCCSCEVPLDAQPNGHAASVPTVAEARLEMQAQEDAVAVVAIETLESVEVVEAPAVVDAIEVTETTEPDSVPESGSETPAEPPKPSAD